MAKQPVDSATDMSHAPAADSTPSAVSPSLAEASTLPRITITVGGLVQEWMPTTAVRPGKCSICSADISGEQARIYQWESIVHYRIVDGVSKDKRDEKLRSRMFQRRYHSLMAHTEPTFPVYRRSVEYGDEPRRVINLYVKQTEPLDAEAVKALEGDLHEVNAYAAMLQQALMVAYSAQEHILRALRSAPAETQARVPYRSDVKVKCRKCNAKTYWRLGSGAAQCQPECAEEKVIITETRRASRQASIEAAARILFDEEDD